MAIPRSDLETVLQAVTAFLDESLLNAQARNMPACTRSCSAYAAPGESFVRNLEDLFERPDSLTVADVLEVHQLCLLLGFRAHLSSLEIRYLLRQIERENTAVSERTQRAAAACSDERPAEIRIAAGDVPGR